MTIQMFLICGLFLLDGGYISIIGYDRYTENGSDLDVNQPLLNLQDKFGGEKSDEEKYNTDTYATDDYMLTLDNLKYKVLSKSYKENNKILTVIFVNAGDLTDKEQKYLYQVYDTTKFN